MAPAATLATPTVFNSRSKSRAPSEEDDEELEGEEGGRSDSDGSRAAGEDEGYDDDEF